MRKIGLIGSGQASLILAHTLLQEAPGRHEITLYSDKSASDWLHESWPTGSSAQYASTYDIEREMGLDFWSRGANPSGSTLIDLCLDPPDGPRFEIRGARPPGGRTLYAIDQRMKNAKWMEIFASQGGKVVLERVERDELDDLATLHDLLLVGVGKGQLGSAFARDAKRSDGFEAPARQLCWLMVEGFAGYSDREVRGPCRFNLLVGIGEQISIPFTHKSAGHCDGLLFEAVPGGPMDRFRGVQDAKEACEIAKNFFQEYLPWDAPRVANILPVQEDRFAVFAGAVTPTVREPLATLPSGRSIMPLGDVLICFDPLCAQGGNNATHHGRFVGQAIVERGDEAFDANWIRQVNEEFWRRWGGPRFRFNNTFLREPDEAIRLLLAAASADAVFADEFLLEPWSAPWRVMSWLGDLVKTRKIVNQFTGMDRPEWRLAS
jgi:hypothetical protein